MRSYKSVYKNSTDKCYIIESKLFIDNISHTINELDKPENTRNLKQIELTKHTTEKILQKNQEHFQKLPGTSVPVELASKNIARKIIMILESPNKKHITAETEIKNKVDICIECVFSHK